MVEIATLTVRHLLGLVDENRMDKVRASRWLLAPLSTFRLWRRMRLWEITNYKLAVSREQQQSASRALLKEWHGRSWRRSAPRAERLAVRLQATSERPVAELLTESAEAIVAAARAAVRPLSEAEQAAAFAAAPDVPEAEASLPEVPAKPRPVRPRTTGKKPAKTPALRRTDEQLLAEASALNALVVSETGAPVSVRRMRTELRVGQPVAERIRTALLTARQPAPEPGLEPALEDGTPLVVQYANGATV